MESIASNYDDLQCIFNILIDCSNDGYWIWDLENPDYEYLSPRFKEILGYKDHEMENSPRSWQSMIHPDDLKVALENVDKHLKDPSYPYYQIVRYTHRDQHTVWVICRGVALRNQDGKPVKLIGTHTDITELKEKELLLEKEKRSKEMACQSRDIFLASVSHEIRTPMNGILGLVDVILAENRVDAETQETIRYVKESAERLAALLDDILEFSKFNSSRISLNQKPFDIKRTVEKLIAVFRPNCREKKISITLRIHPNVPEILYGDKNRYLQILTNLVSNAVKYTESGKIRVTIRKMDANGLIRTKVRDTGIGISKQQQLLIFEPFVRANHDQIKGTGLGLAVTKKICDAMGGRLWVRSKLGSGSSFYCELRFDLEGTNQASLLEAQSPSETDWIANLQVAIAEDNKINQIVFGKMLRILGITSFDVVYDGREIVRTARGKSYDIIFMDEVMPGLTGVEAAKKIRKFDKNVRIVAVTANAMSGDREKFLKIMDDYLSKPINLNKLKECIQRCKSI